jgi:hypothetical protein
VVKEPLRGWDCWAGWVEYKRGYDVTGGGRCPREGLDEAGGSGMDTTLH